MSLPPFVRRCFLLPLSAHLRIATDISEKRGFIRWLFLRFPPLWRGIAHVWCIIVASKPLWEATMRRENEAKRWWVNHHFALLSPAWSGVYSLSILGCGLLYSSGFQHFHVTIMGLAIGPLDMLLSPAGLLTIIGGGIAWRGLLGSTPKDGAR
jgi:hypothetical protein